MTVQIQQSTTADPLFFYLTSSTDHISPLTGLGSGAVVTLSKNGAAFAAPSGAISEIANGWYQVAGNATDTGTLGALMLHATGTGADPSDTLVAQIVAYNPRNANLGLSNVAVNVAQWNGTNVATPATAGIPDVNTKNLGGTAQTGRDVGASVLLSSGTGAGQLSITSGVAQANLAQILGTALTETAGQLAAAFKQWFNVATPTGTVNSIPNAVAGAASGLALVGSNMGTVSSVTGAVGSVTGNVGGSVASVVGNVGGSVASVTGAVGSVTGAVGSVTGNVGGNVVGTVASVVGNVGGNVTGSVGSVAGNVSGSVGSVAGNVSGSVASVVGNVGGSVASVVGAVGSVTARVAITSNVQKNSAGRVTFTMTDSVTHAPKTGLTVGSTVIVDGAAPGATVNAVTEVANGDYTLILAAGDTNGNDLMFRFTATGADDLNLEFVTQP